jgi:hypothetical protein
MSLIQYGTDNPANNPTDSFRFMCYWNSNTFGTTTSAQTYEFFDTAGNDNTSMLPSSNRMSASQDIIVWRVTMEPTVVGQTPATALDLNALVSGSHVKLWRNRTELLSQFPATVLANSGGGVLDPGNAASNAQVSTYGVPDSRAPFTLPSFGQWEIAAGQFFHIDWIVSSAITLGASTVIKLVLWTQLKQPAS